jgi:hypothetical protein
MNQVDGWRGSSVMKDWTVALESSYLTQKWINDSNSRLVVYLLTAEFVGRWLPTAATAVPSESSLKGKRNQLGI